MAAPAQAQKVEKTAKAKVINPLLHYKLLHPRTLPVGGKHVRLIPGLNDHISAEDWAAAKKDPEIAALVDDGALLEMTVDRGPKGELPETLESLDANTAKEFVNGVTDEVALAKWLKDEDRKSVQQAITTQIEAVKTFNDKLNTTMNRGA